MRGRESIDNRVVLRRSRKWKGVTFMEKREEQKRKGCVRNRIQELCPLVVCF